MPSRNAMSLVGMRPESRGVASDVGKVLCVNHHTKRAVTRVVKEVGVVMHDSNGSSNGGTSNPKSSPAEGFMSRV